LPSGGADCPPGPAGAAASASVPPWPLSMTQSMAICRRMTDEDRAALRALAEDALAKPSERLAARVALRANREAVERACTAERSASQAARVKVARDARMKTPTRVADGGGPAAAPLPDRQQTG